LIVKHLGAIQLPKILYKSSHFCFLLFFLAAKLIFQFYIVPFIKDVTDVCCNCMVKIFAVCVFQVWMVYVILEYLSTGLSGLMLYILYKKNCKIVYRCSQRCIVCVCSEVVAPPPRVWGGSTLQCKHIQFSACCCC